MIIKNFFLPVLIVLFFIVSCEEEPALHTQAIHNIQDSLFKVLPTVNRLSIEVKDDDNVIVTIGDAQLFKAPENARKNTVQKITDVSSYYFKKFSGIKKGKIIFVANETSVDTENEPSKNYSINFK